MKVTCDSNSHTGLPPALGSTVMWLPVTEHLSSPHFHSQQFSTLPFPPSSGKSERGLIFRPLMLYRKRRDKELTTLHEPFPL